MVQPLPQRKSPRLKAYDYSQPGAFFITICTFRRLYLFGHIDNGIMNLNDLGSVAEAELINLPQRWNSVAVDLYVVMPNHLHVIIIRDEIRDTHKADAQKRVPTLGQIVGNFKGGVTRIARECKLIMDDTEAGQLWQGRYHDHIIRNEQTLNQMRAYIADNPARWEADMFFNAEF